MQQNPLPKMLTNYLLAIALIAFVIPYGSALTCLRCSNVTGDLEIRSCGNPANQTCDAGQDSCEIIVFRAVTGFGPSVYMERNCSKSADCGKRCNQINETKVQKTMTECRIHCCEGDRCNQEFPAKEATTAAPGNTTKTKPTQPDVKASTTESGVSPIVQLASGITCVMMLAVSVMVM